MAKYENLFKPFTIKNTTFKNRIIMAPMGTAMPTYNGKMNDMAINYYTERAKGGAGLITLEAAAVTFKGIGWNHNLGVYNDSQIPGLKKLAEKK